MHPFQIPKCEVAYSSNMCEEFNEHLLISDIEIIFCFTYSLGVLLMYVFCSVSTIFNFNPYIRFMSHLTLFETRIPNVARIHLIIIIYILDINYTHMFKLSNYITFVNSRVVKSKNLIMFHVIQNKKKLEKLTLLTWPCLAEARYDTSVLMLQKENKANKKERKGSVYSWNLSTVNYRIKRLI